MVLRIFGVKVKIEYAFLLMLAFAVFVRAENVLWVILFSSLHEIGHILSLYLLGGRAECVTLSFYGIGLKHSAQLGRAGELAFLGSGCLVNLVFVFLNIKREINFPLFMLNVLPIYPLDGGRIAKALFGINEKLFRFVSALFLVTLLIYSVYLRNINLILITVYLAIFSFNEDLR